MHKTGMRFGRHLQITADYHLWWTPALHVCCLYSTANVGDPSDTNRSECIHFCLWGSDSACGAALEWFGRCHWKNFDAHVGLWSQGCVDTYRNRSKRIHHLFRSENIRNHIKHQIMLQPWTTGFSSDLHTEAWDTERLSQELHVFLLLKNNHVRSKFQSLTNSKLPDILAGYFWVSCLKLRKTVVVFIAFPPTLWMGSRLDGKPSPICVQYPELLRSLEFSLFFDWEQPSHFLEVHVSPNFQVMLQACGS